MRWLRGRDDVRRPLVLEVQGDEVVVEGDDRFMTTGRPERVAVIAHWNMDARIDRSSAELVRALLGHGYEVLLVSTAPGSSRLEMPPDLAGRLTVLRRPNLGYDFGSWATALDRYPVISQAPQALLMNTSLVGPFAALDDLLAHFDQTSADVWGITDSTQFGRHIQSYCLGFKAGSLAEAPIARFWRELRVERDREAVIEHGELALGRLLRQERFVTDVAIPYWRVVADEQNPTIIGWRALLDHGFPFVKRQLLREPQVAPDGHRVQEEIARRFGQDADAWV